MQHAACLALILSSARSTTLHTDAKEAEHTLHAHTVNAFFPGPRKRESQLFERLGCDLWWLFEASEVHVAVMRTIICRVLAGHRDKYYGNDICERVVSQTNR